MFVSTLVQRAALRWPNREAVADENVILTFAALAERVYRMAHTLRGLGLVAGDRVIDLQKNSHTYLESDLACAVAGLVRVPVNVRLTPKEWAYIAGNSDAKAIIFGGEFSDQVRELLDESEIEIALCTEPDGPGKYLEDLMGKASDRPLRLRHRAEDIVSLNYSSGTTGKPKGCIRTAANRLVSMHDMLVSLFEGQLSSDDVFLHAGPITHASGLFVLPHLAVGAKQVLMRSFDEERVKETLENEPITGSVLVPTMLERVLATLKDGGKANFGALRRMAYAGAPMPADRIAAANEVLDGKMVQFYGLVEAIPPLSVLRPRDHGDPALLKSAGMPALGVDISVVDDQNNEVEQGTVGELLVGGQHVMQGYWDNPEETVKSVDAGWLKTGDMAYLDEHGYLYLVDRRADMIITGGFNVMPREIELVLSELDAVMEVAVIGVPDAKWGEAVTAFVVPTPGVEVASDELMAHCAANLSGFKKPKRIEFLSELPKSSTGKISRSSLKEMVNAGATGQ